MLKDREYEAEMYQKAIIIANSFLKNDMECMGEQVKELIKYIYQVPFQSKE